MLASTGAVRISTCSASTTPIKSPTSTAQPSRTSLSWAVNHLPTAGASTGTRASSTAMTPAATASGSQSRAFFFGLVFICMPSFPGRALS